MTALLPTSVLLHIGTMGILMDASWIYRCEECNVAVDGDERLCEACLDRSRDPDFGPVAPEMVREEMAYERWKEERVTV